MTTYPMHYTDNANSWTRMGMLARLYWPGLKLGLFICIILPLLCVFLSAAVTKLVGHPTTWLFSWPITMLLYLSPIMLTRRDYRDISAQLPVTTPEKFGFLLLTFWIVIPAVIYLSFLIGKGLSAAVFGDSTIEMLDIPNEQALMIMQANGCGSIAGNILTSLIVWAIVSVVLYYTVTSKKNRVLSAVVSLIVISVVSGLFAGIIGGFIGFIACYQGTADGLNDQAITTSIQHMTFWILSITYILIEAISIIYLVKLYKRLRNCGF